ncbi:MAG: DUF6171 family protein [Lachnospiraceae bacterium]
MSKNNTIKDDCPVCPKKISYTHEQFKEDLSHYTSIIKEKDRADRDEYERRLSTCNDCKFQSNGLCTQCGCFTEIRCLLKNAHCPAASPLW